MRKLVILVNSGFESDICLSLHDALKGSAVYVDTAFLFDRYSLFPKIDRHCVTELATSSRLASEIKAVERSFRSLLLELPKSSSILTDCPVVS